MISILLILIVNYCGVMGGVIIAVCRVLVYYISYLKFDFLIFDYLSRTAEIEEHKPNSRDEQNNQHL